MNILATAVAAGPSLDVIYNAIALYGPLGLTLAWFMIKAEARLEKVADRIDHLAHKINGLTRAMLAEVIARDSTGAKARQIAQQMLDEMDRPKTK